MNRKAHYFPKVVLLGALLAAQGAFAGDTDARVHERSDQEPSELRVEVREAWMEGKLETIYLVNRHLNNFAIDVEVDGNEAQLVGKVESEVDRELAEELARGVDGIDDVDNQLEIAPREEARDDEADNRRDYAAKIEDATLTAEVKLKLMANSEVSGLSIDVDTLSNEVVLAGEVESSAERDLAEQIVRNIDGVEDVKNKLQVKS